MNSVLVTNVPVHCAHELYYCLNYRQEVQKGKPMNVQQLNMWKYVAMCKYCINSYNYSYVV